MKRLKTLLFLLFAFFAHAQAQSTLHFSNGKSANQFKISNVSSKGFALKVNVESVNMDQVTFDGATFFEMQFDGAYRVGELGKPQIPAYKRLILIPRGAECTVRATFADTTIYQLDSLGYEHKLVPFQPSYSKNEKARNIKFHYDKKHYKNKRFANRKLVEIERIGTFRGADLAQITVSPIDYNPSTNELKVYSGIDIKVNFEGAIDSKSQLVNFQSVYKQLLNAEVLTSKSSAKSDCTDYPIKYLIICPDAFVNQMRQFAQWKSRKGYSVELVSTATTGTTSDNIKSWIKERYNQLAAVDSAPTYLLLVGDTKDLPYSQIGIKTGLGTDLYYACIDGDDDYVPDMYFGRFSASTTDDLQAIIDKTLTYEQYKFVDDKYLNSATLVAGYDASYTSKIVRPTIKYALENYFNESHGYTTVNSYLTINYTGCYSNESVSVGFYNYSGHGSTTTWVDPELKIATVNEFQNIGKYPFVVANCCYSGNFPSSGTKTCIGEAWLRKPNAGAVCYIGSIDESFWYEDFYWAVGAHSLSLGDYPTVENSTTGAYDAPFVSDNVTAGAIMFVGNLAVSEAHDSNYPSQKGTQYYWETYNCLGDPSLAPYYAAATENTVELPSVIMLGSPTLSVKAESGSLVAISKDNVLINSAVAVDGVAVLNTSLLTDVAVYDIVVTKAQRKPVITTISSVLPNQPFLVINETNISDQNSNGVVESGEQFAIELKIANLGKVASSNATVSITTTSNFVTLKENNTNIPIQDLENQLSTTTQKCYFTLNNSVPDLTIIPFKITINSGEYTFEYETNVTVKVPKIKLLSTIKVDDSKANGNHLWDYGETVNLVVKVINEGHFTAETPIVDLALEGESDFVNLLKQQIVLPNIEPNSEVDVAFAISSQRITAPVAMVAISASVVDKRNLTSHSASYVVSVGEEEYVTVGAGTKVASDYPFNNVYENNKTQILYTAADLGGKPLQIRNLAFDIYKATPENLQVPLANFVIRLKHTSLNSLGEFVDMSDCEPVVDVDGYMLSSQTGWEIIDFDRGFLYNGTDNLLAEIVWGDNDLYVNNTFRTVVKCHSTSFYSVSYGYSDSLAPPDYYDRKKIRPNTRFNVVRPNWLSVTVKDPNNKTIPGALVSVADIVCETNSFGQVMVPIYGVGALHRYKVQAQNYKIEEGEVLAIDDTTQLVVNMQLGDMWNVTINVINGEQFVNNATVTFGNQTLQTVNGTVTFTGRYYGETQLEIRSTGCVPYADKVITTADTAFIVNLDKSSSIKLRVTDGVNAVVGASVLFDNLQQTITDANGEATVYGAMFEYYDLKIEHHDFQTYYQKVSVSQSNGQIDVVLQSPFCVTFNITDGNNAIQNAEVQVDGQSYFSDSQGVVTICNVRQDKLKYSVLASGCAMVTDSVVVDYDSNIKIKLLKKQCNVVFYVHTQDSALLSSAIVTVYGQNQMTNKLGATTFTGLISTDALPFEVHYGGMSLYDTVALISENQTVNVYLHQQDTSIEEQKVRLKFYVTSEQVPMVGASLLFDGNEVLTNETGVAIVTLPKGGTCTFVISNSGFKNDTVLVELDESKNIQIAMIKLLGVDNQQFSSFKLWPNPSNGIFNIELESSNSAHLSVYNTCGLKEAEYELLERESKVELNLPSGIYILRISTLKWTKTEQIIIIKQ
ncbi:MAG: C25 family cysteine peptidase [Salinivirgaceae bacterium]|nr:C25 family cysteine peptidase [Salinivirgaceae bacterium]